MMPLTILVLLDFRDETIWPQGLLPNPLSPSFSHLFCWASLTPVLVYPPDCWLQSVWSAWWWASSSLSGVQPWPRAQWEKKAVEYKRGCGRPMVGKLVPLASHCKQNTHRPLPMKTCWTTSEQSILPSHLVIPGRWRKPAKQCLNGWNQTTLFWLFAH
jgi:hypothetical protein